MYLYTQYSTVTGEILTVNESSGQFSEAQKTAMIDVGFFEGSFDKNIYCMDISDALHVPILKKDNPSTIMDMVISNIPNPSTVGISSIGKYTVVDGVFDFTLTTPGTYAITVSSITHLGKVFEVSIP